MKCFPYLICCCMWICLGWTQAQFAPLKQVSSPECDGHNKEYLVEKFFNLIFTEFQNVPPVCICVQMCPDQPTYCYPSGCMSPMQNKKYTDDGGTHAENNDENKLIVNEIANPFIYVVDGNGNSVLNDFAQLSGKAGIVGNAKPHMMTGISDLMKDRVKILFKYKKLPKLEVRYNLKEHVKHVNMDKQQKDFNFKRNNAYGETMPVKSFRSKAIKPHFTTELTYKKLGRNVPASPIAAFLLNELNKNTYNKRDVKKNLQELDSLKATVLLKQNIMPGNEDTPVLVYSVIDDLINTTALREMIETD